MDISKLIEVICTSQLITNPKTNRGLINFVTGANIEPEIAHDILNSRTVGRKDYETAVKYYFFKDPSITFKRKKRKLLTFTSVQRKKRKKSPALQEQKIITLCTKRAIAWATKHGTDTNCIGMQFIEQPRALVDVNNKPTNRCSGS